MGLTGGSGGVLVRWCCYPGEVMLLRSSTRHGQGGGTVKVPMANEDDGKAKLGEDGAVHGVGAVLLVAVWRGEEGDAMEVNGARVMVAQG